MNNYGKNLIMKKANNFIEKNISKILTIFILFQPILDSLTGICANYLKFNITIGAISRIIFLTFCMYYIVFMNKTKNKTKSIIFLLCTLLYFSIFSFITIKYKSINALTYELKNTINTFFILIVLISFLDMFKQYNIKIKLITLVITYLEYLLLIIIPNLTHTGFLSYAHSKLGNVGWFLSANGVGNILSILLPFIIYFIITNKTKKIIKIIIILSTLYVFASIGTKVPVLSLLICIITTLLYYIIKWSKEKNIKNISISIIATALLIIISVIALPKTSFYKNIQIHKNYLGINNYLEIFKDYNLIDHFIFSQRLTFLKNTHNNYKKSNILEKIIGIGYIENYGTDNVSLKTIEIDYFDILYRNGIIGFIMYIYILYSYILKEKQKEKRKKLLNTQYSTSILLILLLSLFSGHVLVAPPVSIFVALILTIILQGGLNEKINER